MSIISITTWNVNSVRARAECITKWLQQHAPDILLLQETKCENHLFPKMEFCYLGYNCQVVGQKSYNGVAVLSKYPITIEEKNLDSHDKEARFLECTIGINGRVVRVGSVYVPNGDSVLKKGEKLEDSSRFLYKLKWLDELDKKMKNLLAEDYKNEIIVFGGDYNVAHEAIDLHNPKKAEDGVGFHHEERSRLNKILNCGYVDVWRELHPGETGYSWWDYRHDGWNKNRGWRIDYLLMPRHSLNQVKSCVMHKEVRAYSKPSDHVPITLTIQI